MVDILILGTLLGAVRRGWRRGLAHEAFDLSGVLVSAWASLRFAEPAGRFIARWWVGLEAGSARLIGGVAVFVAVSALIVVIGRRVAVVGRQPGLGITNQVGGAAVAVGWAWVLVTVVATVVVLSPLGSAGDLLAGPIEDSRLVAAAVDPDQPVQRLLRAVTGDRSLQAALGLQNLLGTQHVVLDPSSTHDLEPADPDDLVRDRDAELVLLELVNRARFQAGRRRLTANPALTDVAAAYATTIAVTGRFGHEGVDGDTVGDRVRAAGIRYRVVAENLALAATVDMAHQGLMASDGHRANLLSPDVTDVGIAVVSGPLGLYVVQVFTG